jgi:hypothetical protein
MPAGASLAAGKTAFSVTLPAVEIEMLELLP